MAETSGDGDYRLCGWRVRSTLPLPELVPWTGDETHPPDIVIAETDLPERLDGPDLPSRYLMVGANGEVLLHIPGLVRLLIAGGREILVHRLGTATDSSWRSVMLGAGLGYLSHQRDILPLHAASLRSADGTASIAIAGRRGVGKSTLALTLIGRGWNLLSDDLAMVRGSAVLPTFPRLKMWRPALAAAGVGIDGLTRVREGMEKYHLRPQDDFDPNPAPLGAVVILNDAPDLSLERLPEEEASLRPHICHPRIATLLGRQNRLSATSAALARVVPIYRLNRPRRFDRLAEAADLIQRTVGSGTGAGS